MNPSLCPPRSKIVRGLDPTESGEEPTLDHLYEQVLTLYEEIADFEKSMQAVLDHLHRAHHPSARNLLHYVAFRQRDIRDLQGQLSALGLSSLGRAEACLLPTLRQVLMLLGRLAEKTHLNLHAEPAACMDEGKAALTRNTAALFGHVPPGRTVRIMVTMPTEAAHSYEHVRDLLANGMDCMRINCAHDDATAWTQMIEHLHRARQELQKPCSVLMDLGGPKLRTGPIAHGPAIHKWRPTRDALGRVTRSVRVLFIDATQTQTLPKDVDFPLPIPREWLELMRLEDQVVFQDARSSWRKLRIVKCCDGCVIAECRKTAYLVPGLKLRLRRRHTAGKKWRLIDVARLCNLTPTEQTILVKPGERILLTDSEKLGQPAIRDETGHVLEAARIGCTLPEVFADLQIDQQIWFDDGKIGGRIIQIAPESVEVEITHARSDGSKLGADKGINLPDTRLRLPSLTAKDIEDLRFVVQHADLVGYSFVRTPQDVVQLQEHLHDLGGDHLGIILKIETRHAFEQLPHLLLAAMRSPRAGVMIARGDLAIECGYERMAELQEEILWFCEAAHLPVIWATQVLEHLTKEGIPSRAEITDAAMGQRAECVMLNKGPHVVEAVQTLDNILKRMADHQAKKRSMLRPLKMAGRFDE
jgi:pyruvate kinase